MKNNIFWCDGALCHSYNVLEFRCSGVVCQTLLAVTQINVIHFVLLGEISCYKNPLVFHVNRLE